MKVNVEIDCSPEEARAFLGLPDVQPMQEALMKELEQRLRANLQAMDPEVIVRTWLPASLQGAEQLQKMFWSQVQQMLAGVADATAGMANLTARKTGNDA
jgi:hypothetical protein